ncbi:MAG: S8 family peptidase [Microcoleus sp.]
MTSTQTNVTDISTLPGLNLLWSETQGDSQICVAILDGPVDQSHPCFDGANLTRLQTLVSDEANTGLMSEHGTHITSVIFGQHSSPIPGIAPGCRGLIVPVFSDHQTGSLSQLDLARAINQAVEQGAHVINISGGQLAQTAEADQMLANAVRFCHDNGVLIVAAAGNDGCQCLHVPAALPSVLAVGAMNARGLPFDFSNWGDTYQTQGILAPGENILGAARGGGTALKSGTSFATPIISGIVALLLSLQLQRGEKPHPHAIRDAILKSALPCNSDVLEDWRRCLRGSLNIPGTYALITKGGKMSQQKLDEAIIQPSEADNIRQEQIGEIATLPAPAVYPSAIGLQESNATTSQSTATTIEHPGNTMPTTSSHVTASSVTPSNVVSAGNCGCNGGPIASSVMPSNATKSLVYALGELGYDFGTEARRDSFKQLMPMVTPEGLGQTGQVPANPYDSRQMVSYLRSNLSEAKSLIWTLNLELTPIYAIQPAGEFARDVYEGLRDFLAGEILSDEDDNYIERISIPGYLTGQTVKLFSGQVIPVIEINTTRGMYGWKTNELVNAVIASSGAANNPEEEAKLRESLKFFLTRIYYDFRNLGQTSNERALNYAATNAFQVTEALDEARGKNMQLADITVEKSPFCRMDSDCWDVKLIFFDPENNDRARIVYRFTIDVSDVTPVTVGQLRSWTIAE